MPPALELQVGLELHPGQRLARELGDRRSGGELGECAERVHARSLEPDRLRALDGRHQRDVVVRAAAIGTALPPRAELAVLDLVRVGHPGAGPGGQFGAALEVARADALAVGGELLRPVAVPLAVSEHEVHPSRLHTLDARQLTVVEEQLEDVARPAVARQLGVVDLVGVRPERRVRVVDADEEVREADPAVVLQAGLVDHVGACAHGLDGRRGALGIARAGVDLDDAPALLAMAGEYPRLVLEAALTQPVVRGAPVVRTRQLPALDEQVEPRAVLAAEEVVEATRRQHAPTPP